MSRVDCFRCDGEGLIGVNNCPRCSGSGDEPVNTRPHDQHCADCDLAEFQGVTYETTHGGKRQQAVDAVVTQGANHHEPPTRDTSSFSSPQTIPDALRRRAEQLVTGVCDHWYEAPRRNPKYDARRCLTCAHIEAEHVLRDLLLAKDAAEAQVQALSAELERLTTTPRLGCGNSACEFCYGQVSPHAQLQALSAERDQARADAGELVAIQALVSDRDEVGTYAKVEGIETALTDLRSRLGAVVQQIVETVEAVGESGNPEFSISAITTVKRWEADLAALLDPAVSPHQEERKT